jgi:hypothetical protein
LDNGRGKADVAQNCNAYAASRAVRGARIQDLLMFRAIGRQLTDTTA